MKKLFNDKLRLCLAIVVVGFAGALSTGCGNQGSPEVEAAPSFSISSTRFELAPGESQTISAEVSGVEDDGVIWQASGGTISGTGTTITYTAPPLVGDYSVTATSVADDGLTATAAVRVVAQPFTIVVLPDTQNMIRDSANTMVEQMTNWIVQSADDLDIAFVTHVGDVVDRASKLDQWERADRALSVLDGQIPYSVAFGDHEYEVEEDMGSSYANYLAYFGPGRYADYPWYQGSSPSGKNHYQIFTAGGRRFLHLALEWEAAGPATDGSTPLGWARGILEGHPDLPTIITTHAYLWDEPGREGRFPDSAREGFMETESGTVWPGTSGAGIYEALVEPYPQVFMVLNGHYHLVPGDGEDTAEGEYHQVSLNEAELPVFEMLSNYQAYDGGGEGWLRLIEFEPGGGAGGLDLISVRTYSPVMDAFQTDPRSQFSFEVTFEERFDLTD